MTVLNRESVVDEYSLLPGVVVGPLDRQLEILAGVGNRTQQVHGAQRDQREVGAVRRTRQPRRRRHPHDPERARYPAHVHDVGLNDVDRAHLDHPRPGGEIAVLLAAGHVELERIADPFGLLELPVRAWLLVVTDPLGLEQMPDLDGAAGGEAAVRIHELSDPVAERARHPRHDRLGAAGPFIDVASALGADAPLESVEALFVPQAHEPRRLVGWLNVSSHRGGIGAKPPRPATEQLDHGPALELAAQVPQRGVEPGERAAAVAARELVLALLDAIDQGIDLERVGTERPGGDLTVEDGGGDVGVVGRGLTPADCAGLGGHADEAHELAGEGLEARDLHRAVPAHPPAARSARVPEASVPLAVDAAMAPTGP